MTGTTTTTTRPGRPGTKLNGPKVLQHHKRSLRILNLLSTLLTLSLLYGASRLPLFDSSPRTVLDRTSSLGFLAEPLLRWDVFHFAHIAEEGYMYEYEWAFFPGSPLLMRAATAFVQAVHLLPPGVPLSIRDLLLGGALVSCLCGTTSILYDLTMHHFQSSSMAYLACLLSLLPSSPATLRFSACSEPFFTYLSYKGMWYCSQSKWLLATLCFLVASAFRSNGIMLCVYLVWGLVGEPLLITRKLSLRHLFKAASLCILIFLPILYHQYRAYAQFCTTNSMSSRPPWCSSKPPAIYGYVQERYWNVGFLRYWTLSQLPNILLAVPPLASIITFALAQLRACLLPSLFTFLNISVKPLSSSRGLMNISLTPYAVHSLALACVLLFAAHTQIALRLVAALPFTYWAAAWLVVEYPRVGRWWVSWSVIWGALSIVLWAVFLPPA